MCRSIKTLRPPFTDVVTGEDVEAAALQYVRKIAGMRAPSRANQAAFDQAVAQVTAATDALLTGLTVRQSRPGAVVGTGGQSQDLEAVTRSGEASGAHAFPAVTVAPNGPAGLNVLGWRVQRADHPDQRVTSTASTGPAGGSSRCCG